MLLGSESLHDRLIGPEQPPLLVPPKALSLRAVIARKKSGQAEAALVIESMAHRCILEALKAMKCCILHVVLISAEEPSETCLVSF